MAKMRTNSSEKNEEMKDFLRRLKSTIACPVGEHAPEGAEALWNELLEVWVSTIADSPYQVDQEGTLVERYFG